MMKKFIKENQFKLCIWAVIALSVALNVYLILNKYTNIGYSEEEIAEADLGDIGYEQDFQGFDAAAANDAKMNFGTKVLSQVLSKSETLEQVLKNNNISNEVAKKISDSFSASAKLGKLKMGAKVQIELERSISKLFSGTSVSDQPKRVVVFQDKHKYEIALNEAKAAFETKKTEIPSEWKVKLVSGTINGSLYSAAKKVGADSKVVGQFINLYSYDVDFQRDIQAGDSFKILYEYQVDFNGKAIGAPRIISASLNFSGESKDLYRYEMPNGRVDYYDTKGNSIKRALLKTPIHSAKISSHFGLRTHPVHGYSKMHQGLDYSAPKGTPVLAAGDGVVQFVKSQGRGYGNHVQIKHNGTYSTLYAHLSKFGPSLKTGAKIRQGQVIGYVGATGTATGPHLHYEVIQNGKKVNPARIKAPVFLPLKGVELAKFKESTRKIEQMIAELDDGSKINQVAKKN